jgi:hypothetical protein
MIQVNRKWFYIFFIACTAKNGIKNTARKSLSIGEFSRFYSSERTSRGCVKTPNIGRVPYKLLVLLFYLLFGSACYGEISVSIANELEFSTDSLKPSTWIFKGSIDSEFEFDEQHFFKLVIFDKIQYSRIGTVFNNNEGEINSTFEARELSLRGWGEHFDWIVGKQIVSWGNSDGLRILDIVNPIYFDDFLKFDFQDMKKSLWMTNFKFSWQNSYVQLLLIPEHRSNQSLETVNPLVGVQQNFNAKGLNVADISQEEYDLGEKLSFGVELGSTLENDFDFTVNFLKTYEQDALIRVGPLMLQGQQPALTLRESFPEKTMMGGSFSTQFLDWVFRGEVGYFPDRYFNVLTENNLSIERYNNFVFVVGADYSYNDWFFSVQYTRDRVFASPALLAREHSENVTTMSLSKQFWNDTLEIGFKGLMSTNHHSGLVRPYLNYSLSDRMDITLLMSSYFGSEDDVFSSLSQDDFVRLGFKFEF